MKNPVQDSDARAMAEAVRAACLKAALDAYEMGGMNGLCAEGRLELALDAIRALDVSEIVARQREEEAANGN